MLPVATRRSRRGLVVANGEGGSVQGVPRSGEAVGKLAGMMVAAVALIAAGFIETWLIDALDLPGRPHWLGRSAFWAVVVAGVVVGVRLSFWIDERGRGPSDGASH